MLSGLIEVRATRLKSGKFQYTGVTSGGELVTLRKSATRLYEFAFYYEAAISTGTTGLASHFSYGKQPGNHYSRGGKVNPVETFKVMEEEHA
jgi:hypothetical protein